jgi:RNA polymerase sigma-70 factor (ECF subfamily)
LRVADPERGKFRTFLLVRLKHFLSDQRKKSHAQKRGGGQHLLSLDAALAEEWFSFEPAAGISPEASFDRAWAMAVMEQSVARLRQEYAAGNRVELFEAIKHFQSGEAADSYAEAATRLGLSEGAIKSAIYRLRQRHRELLREEIAQTLATPAELEEEIRYLIKMLASDLPESPA